jgi:hypothetical protein
MASSTVEEVFVLTARDNTAAAFTSVKRNLMDTKKAFSGLAAGLGVAGLGELASGSREAAAALGTLSAAAGFMAIGGPLLAGIVAVAGAFAFFRGRAQESAEATALLAEELRRLGLTADQIKMEELGKQAAAGAGKVLEAEDALKRARAKLAGADPYEDDVIALQRAVDRAAAQLKRWQALEQNAHDDIATAREESTARGIEGLRNMATTMEQAALKTEQGAEAAAWFALQQGEMGAALERGEPQATAYAAQILALARAQDQAAAGAKRHRAEEKLVADSMRDAEEAARKFEQVQRETTDLILDALPEMEREYARFQQRLNKSALSPEDQKQMLDQWVQNWAAAHDEISVFADQAARNMQSAFADFLFDPFQDGLDGLLKNFLQIIQRMIAEIATVNILGSLFPNSSSGVAGLSNFVGGLFGGGGRSLSFGGTRAGGGPVSSGKAYLVGEDGPEILMAGASGHIIPNGAGGSVTIVQNLTLNGGSAEILPQVLALLAASHAQIKRDISRFNSRGI